MDIIFDIDGTLMDISHRKKYVTQRQKIGVSFAKKLPMIHPTKMSSLLPKHYKRQDIIF